MTVAELKAGLVEQFGLADKVGRTNGSITVVVWSVVAGRLWSELSDDRPLDTLRRDEALIAVETLHAHSEEDEPQLYRLLHRQRPSTSAYQLPPAFGLPKSSSSAFEPYGLPGVDH